MNFNIKSITLLFLICGITANAQLFGEKTGGINSYKVGHLSTALTIPSGIGDNFVSKGAKTKLGAHLNFNLNVYDKIYVGVRLGAFGFEIEDDTFSGAYNKSTTYTIGGMLGYKVIEAEKFGVGIFTGIAEVTYANKRNSGVRFSEKGTSYFLTVDAELKLNRYFQLFAAPELRFDRLNIDAPSQVSDQLNKVNYFIINVGLRVSFWNSEPEDNDQD